MRTKQALTLAALLLSTAAVAQEPLQIARQGNFTVGGTTLQREGTYDNSKFVAHALTMPSSTIKCPPTLAGCH